MSWKAYLAYKPSAVEWLGEIPEHWKVKKLKFIADVKPSSVDKKEAEEEIPVRFLGTNTVYNANELHDGIELITVTATKAEMAGFLLREGDIVLTKDSVVPTRIADVCLVVEPLDNVICGYHLVLIRIRSKEFSLRFMYYYLRCCNINYYFLSEAKGTTIIGIGCDTISGACAIYPPFVEQQVIASFLDRETARIDSLIEKKQRQIELLQEKRSALISHAVTKGLDPNVKMKDSGVEWLGEIPEHWDCGNIRRYANMKTGHTPSRNHPEYWVECTIPWFTLADVWQLRDGKRKYLEQTKEKISKLGLDNSAAELLPTKTVVFSRTASIGFSGIMPFPMATTQDFWNWICGPKLVPDYLLYLFRSMVQEFQALTMGSTHKTIYQPIAAAISISVPPLDEQNMIVDYIEEGLLRIDTLSDDISKSVHLLHEYRTALISAAVTGKIDVRNEASA